MKKLSANPNSHYNPKPDVVRRDSTKVYSIEESDKLVHDYYTSFTLIKA